MNSLQIIALLGALCVLAGVGVGTSVRHRTFLKDVPGAALAVAGLLVAMFGFFALVSYVGFLFYPPGLFVLGIGLGRLMRRLAS